jgi:hypothetical protein
VCSIYDYDFALVEHDLSKYVGVKEKRIDTKKVVKHLGEKGYTKTSLERGIKDAIKYFKETRR